MFWCIGESILVLKLWIAASERGFGYSSDTYCRFCPAETTTITIHRFTSVMGLPGRVINRMCPSKRRYERPMNDGMHQLMLFPSVWTSKIQPSKKIAETCASPLAVAIRCRYLWPQKERPMTRRWKTLLSMPRLLSILTHPFVGRC